MNRKQLLFGLCICATALLFSCKKDNGETTNNNNNNGGGGTTTPGPLFTAVKSMMQTSCAVTGCHVGTTPTGGHDFSNDNTIVAQKSRIKVRAVDQAGTANQMPQPPRAALSATDQKKITDWIGAGGRVTD